MSKWKVLYSEQADWEAREREADRDARVKAAESVELRDLQPGSYPGKVISVVPADGPADREYSPADLVDPTRAVLELELADEDLAALRSRTSRIGANLLPVAVTFDERHGAIGPDLKRAFPLDFLVREKEEEAAQRAAEERNVQADTDWQAEVETWRESMAEAVELDLVFATPAPPRPAFEPIPELEFAPLAARLRRALPPTEVHSGAGLYKVDGTGSTHNDTIAGFLENLLLQSNAFDTTWYATGVSGIVQNEEGPDGVADSAWTLTDSTAAAIGNVQQSLVVADDSAAHTSAVFVKKTTGALSSYPMLQMNYTGGVLRYGQLILDTTNGTVVEVSNVDDSSVEDYNSSYWRVWMTVSNNGTGNTALTVFVKPAGSTDGSTPDEAAATGSVVLYGAQCEKASSPSLYIPTTTAAMHAVLLTTGGLTEDERNGEVLISGGNSYPVIKAYAAQANVVGDPSGESGALTISPYTTIQSALDQLWTDQGAATFTASQYIRTFAGTYDENVAPNVGLTGDQLNGFGLIFEGDPADDRADIIIAPSGGTYGLTFSDAGLCRNAIIRHLTFAGSPNGCGNVGSASNGVRVRDCVFAPSKSTATPVLYGANSEFENCVFTSPGGNRACLSTNGSSVTVRDCRLTGSANDTGLGIQSVKGTIITGCTISKCKSGVSIAQYGVNMPHDTVVANNTIYDCEKAFDHPVSLTVSRFLNNIVEDCTNVFGFYAWPEEAATYHGPDLLLRNNCFHGYTTFALHVDASTKTYTEFTALNGVDAAGDLDATDPLLTAPATDDFSLQTTSPCWDTGHGSGVVTDYLGSVLDPAHPPIGAWSPGALVKTPPTVTVPTPSGTTITATLSGSSHRYRVRLSKADGTEVEEKSRAGAGDVVFTGVAEGTHFRIQAWSVTADDAVALGEPGIVHDAYVANASAQTASGPISLPVENLRILLSNSDDFQALVGAGDAAGALGSIHYPYQDAGDYTRPCALLEAAESWNSRQPAIETVQIFLHDGEMAVTIERDVDSAYQAGGKERDAYLAFTNVVGAIVSDLESGAISYLDVRAVRIVEKARRVARSDKAQGRDYYQTTLAVEWGG